MTECGLRERKKRRTRDALTDAAFALFARKGFEATTIDEIANAVEVSPRTFFRYFASKEDVALAQIDQQLSLMLAELAVRPADEPVLTALKHSMVGVIHACEQGEDGFDAGRFHCTQELLAASPALAARTGELGAARLDELADLVAARMGVEHPGDPRPHLVASVVVSALHLTVKAWRETEPNATSAELVARTFDLLSAGLNYPAAVRA